MFSNLLHVSNQIPCRIIFERGIWCALTAPALIEKDYPVMRRIEIPPVFRLRATAWSAMNKYRWLPFWIATFFEIN
jgi:hypothetical protein